MCVVRVCAFACLYILVNGIEYLESVYHTTPLFFIQF